MAVRSDSIRIASRKTQGVRLFDVADDDAEKVVSAGIVRETDDDEDGGIRFVRDLMFHALKTPGDNQTYWRFFASDNYNGFHQDEDIKNKPRLCPDYE